MESLKRADLTVPVRMGRVGDKPSRAIPYNQSKIPQGDQIVIMGYLPNCDHAVDTIGSRMVWLLKSHPDLTIHLDKGTGLVRVTCPRGLADDVANAIGAMVHGSRRPMVDTMSRQSSVFDWRTFMDRTRTKGPDAAWLVMSWVKGTVWGEWVVNPVQTMPDGTIKRISRSYRYFLALPEGKGLARLIVPALQAKGYEFKRGLWLQAIK